MHTGKHAHSVGVLGLAHPPFSWQLAPDQMHNARLLREAGYETTLVGMQHVAHNDQAGLYALGYDHVVLVEPAPNIASRAKSFLEADAHPNQPFYLEVGFFELHRPYGMMGATAHRTVPIG